MPDENNGGGGLDTLVVDPKFTALTKPEDQRRALAGVSGDERFSKLNDEQTSRYILQHRTMLQSKERLRSIVTKAPEVGQRKLGETPTPLSRFSEITTGVAHPIDTLTQRDIPEAVNRPGQFAEDVGRSAYEGPNEFARALLTHPVETIKGITGGRQFQEDVHAGRYGSAAADVGAGLVNSYMIAKGVQNAPETAEAAAKGIEQGKARVFGPVVRRFAKAGNFELGEAAAETAKSNAQATQEHAGRVSDIQQENRQSLAQARQSSEEKVANVERENTQIQKDYEDSIAKVKESNQNLRDAVNAGVESRKVSQAAAPVIAESLDELERSETAKARAAYPKIDGTAERGDIHSALQKVVDQKLRGAGRVPTSLGRILEDTAPSNEAPEIQGHKFDLSRPSERISFERLKAMGAIEVSEPEPLSFDDLHGMYSEMGRELHQSDLPGDSKSALSAGRDVVRNKMAEMTGAEGKSAQFQMAQHGWRVLENTFRNADPTVSGGSPLARALRTRDPVTGQLRSDYVWNILTDDKAYRVAQELLGRYKAKDLQSSLQLMKEQADAAKAAPKPTALSRLKGLPPPPQMKSMPTSSSVSVKGLPPPPNIAPFNPQEWVDNQLTKYAKGGYESMQSYRPFRLPYSIVDKILRSMVRDPVFRDIVARRAKLPKAMTAPP